MEDDWGGDCEWQARRIRRQQIRYRNFLANYIQWARASLAVDRCKWVTSWPRGFAKIPPDTPPLPVELQAELAWSGVEQEAMCVIPCISHLGDSTAYQSLIKR